MCSVQELQRVDRELFSELVETPINPAFFHLSTPFVDGLNPIFYLQISGEGLWQLRGYVNRNIDVLCAILRDNLSKIGYQLTQSWSSSFRVETLWRTEHNTSSTKHGSRVTAASGKPCDPHFGVKLHFIQTRHFEGQLRLWAIWKRERKNWWRKMRNYEERWKVRKSHLFEGSFKQLNGFKCYWSFYMFYSIRTDRKFNNYIQQTRDVPTGTLGNHRQKTQNERGFFLSWGRVDNWQWTEKCLVNSLFTSVFKKN